MAYSPQGPDAAGGARSPEPPQNKPRSRVGTPGRSPGRPATPASHREGRKERAMTLDEVKRQFVEQVKLRAYDDKYIDKAEEREILQMALQQGVTVDSARQALAQVCEANGYVLESRV